MKRWGGGAELMLARGCEVNLHVLGFLSSEPTIIEPIAVILDATEPFHNTDLGHH